MNVNDEKSFEQYLRELIDLNITAEHKDVYALENKKSVDILICNDKSPFALFFIETKFFTVSKNRLGFGSRDGKGIQPELLDRRPKYFEHNLRWVIGQKGNNKIYFFTNDQMFKYIAGDGIGKKQNNFQKRLFREEKGLTENEFIDELKKWILGI